MVKSESFGRRPPLRSCAGAQLGKQWTPQTAVRRQHFCRSDHKPLETVRASRYLEALSRTPQGLSVGLIKISPGLLDEPQYLTCTSCGTIPANIVAAL